MEKNLDEIEENKEAAETKEDKHAALKAAFEDFKETAKERSSNFGRSKSNPFFTKFLETADVSAWRHE